MIRQAIKNVTVRYIMELSKLKHPQHYKLLLKWDI